MIDQGWKDEEGRMSEVFAGPEAHSLPVLPRDEVGALVFMTYQSVYQYCRGRLPKEWFDTA